MKFERGQLEAGGQSTLMTVALLASILSGRRPKTPKKGGTPGFFICSMLGPVPLSWSTMHPPVCYICIKPNGEPLSFSQDA